MPDAFPSRDSTLPSLRVLVVDRNAANRQLATHTLRSLGHQPFAVTEGDEALDLITQVTFEVVLIDRPVNAPGALEPLRHIRARSGQSERPWIIVTSPAADPAAYDEALTAGANDFIIRSGHHRESLGRALKFAARHLAPAFAAGA